MAYLDKDKQREANRLANKRYRDNKAKGITEGITNKGITMEGITQPTTDPKAGLAPDVVETINRLCPVSSDMTDLQTSERTRRIAAAQHYQSLYPHKAAQHTGVPYAVQQSMVGATA